MTASPVEQLLSLHRRPVLINDFSDIFARLSPQDAYKAAEELHEYRIKEGWKPKGRKIGLTNRAMWARFGVSEPIWGTVYDRTVVDAPHGNATVDTNNLLQPMIEPEICFGLKSALPSTADNSKVLHSIDWIAHSIEIVQCPHPAWKVNLPGSIAFNGLHAKLIIGKRVPLSAFQELGSALLKCEVDLSKNGALAERGKAINVLDNPLNALAYLSELIRKTPGARPLSPGEAITTGSMTFPHPIARGETWTSVLRGLQLPDLTVKFL